MAVPAIAARALVLILPKIAEWIKDYGETVIRSLVQNPSRRAWREYSASALGGILSNPKYDRMDHEEVCQMAANLADQMARLEKERDFGGEGP